MLKDLTALFHPATIAIIGASPVQGKIGARTLAFLRHHRFPGVIYPVNPQYDSIDGLRCYPDVTSLPTRPDLAIIVIPAEAAVHAAQACQQVGIPAALIYTSGFGELGSKGRALEAELRRLASDCGMIICGPNCQGVASFRDNMVANWASALMDKHVPAGPLGIVTQSGMVGGLMIEECLRRGIGLGYVASTGNEVGVQFADVVGHLARDPHIRVIGGYLEAIRDGARFAAAARLAREAGKPLVVLKVGRTPESARAAASHTGSIAGDYEMVRAAFEQWGVLEVDDLDELFDIFKAFALTPRRGRGDRLGMLTNSGGIGVFSADKARLLGMELPQFTASTRKTLVAGLPAFGSAGNPVDVATQSLADPEAVSRHMRTVLNDDNVDAAFFFFGTLKVHVEATVRGLIAAHDQSTKPVVVGWLGGDPLGPRMLDEAGIPTYSSPTTCLKVLHAMIRQGRLERQPTASALPGQPKLQDVFSKLQRLRDRGLRGVGEHAAKEVLSQAGIAVTRERLARSVREALQAAAELGYPVALKVESPDISHKTEVGGVVLNVPHATALRKAYARLRANVRRQAPRAHVEGVIVQEMLHQAVEVIVGIKRDPALGTAVLLGMGGTLVEVIRDVALRMAPLTRADAESLIRSLRSFPILDGFRARPKADVAALADVLLAVSALAEGAPFVQELEINPLMVRAAGQGAVAADAVLTLVGSCPP